MGITVEEYLKDREACAVCGGTEHEQHCVTTMLSRPDNCLIYNAVNHSGQTKLVQDMQALQQLRATPGAANTVLQYYMRSEPLVQRIKLQHGNNSVFWNNLYNQHMVGILAAVRGGHSQPAHDLIFAMLSELEAHNL
jgi:hypothetical protein